GNRLALAVERECSIGLLRRYANVGPGCCYCHRGRLYGAGLRRTKCRTAVTAELLPRLVRRTARGTGALQGPSALSAELASLSILRRALRAVHQRLPPARPLRSYGC